MADEDVMKAEKIYFDMDGVLADFDLGIKELCGMGPRPKGWDQRKEYDDEMWDRVRSVGHFYDKLSLLPGAKEMFDTVFSEYGDRCEILSAVPRPERGIDSAGGDKIRWVRRLLSEDVKINIVLRKEKQNYCTGPGCILIDDLYSNIRSWEKSGGTGILHHSAPETLAKLKDIGVLPE